MTTNRDTSWLTGVEVNERYGISPMTRYRWERDPDLAFPECMKIKRRSFWSLADLQIWESKRVTRSSAA
jgi:predicted DNA-binding transcriptional regulator AlpA